MATLAFSHTIAGQSTAMAAEEGVRPRIRPTGATEDPSASRRGERRLLREAQRGSQEALEVLVRRHWPLAHRAAYLVIGDAAAAEDVAQEALVAVIRSLDRFDLRRPFGPWLHRIAVNRAIDHARARAARGEVVSGTAEEAEARGGSALADVLDSGDGEIDPRADRLRAALAGLSLEHRAIVAMRFLLDLSPGEIAAELGLPRGTVNSRLRRALDRLAADIGEGR
jgi:RNA polymerase sigma-70 factor (ECF subfamily)